MSRFILHTTPIADVFVIERKPVKDERGYLERLYCISDLAKAGMKSVRQINRTATYATGVVRGMHYQRAPAAEMKLVTCVSGTVFDVALDLRAGSATFGQAFGVTLDGQKTQSLLIPEGCAHGFQTLKPDCEMIYFHTADYAPEHESGINPVSAGIDWPLPVSEMSARDAALPNLEFMTGVSE